MEEIIRTEHLIYEYAVLGDDGEPESVNRAVDDVSLSIREGDFVAILGRNGSGKSTFAKQLNALLYPTGGTVWLCGKNTADEDSLWDIRSSAGMVFQNPDNQIIASQVEDDVGFGPENLGVPTEEIWRRVEAALAAVGMQAYAEKSPLRLSGGQKQRVAIAGILAMQPKCLILDEPTAMLDPEGRREVLKAVRELNKAAGITVLLITHYMEETVDADRVIVMQKGKVTIDGTPREIFSRTEEVRDAGLTLPQAAQLAGRLKEAGIPLPDGILTAEELTEELARLYPAGGKPEAPAAEAGRSRKETDGVQAAEAPGTFVKTGTPQGSVLTLSHVTYTYEAGTVMESVGLDDVCLSIRQGEFLGIIGQTGSGKSTLIQHLNGLIKPTSGEILWNGENIYDEKFNLRALRGKVGLVFQYPEHQLFEETVLKDVCFGPRNQGLAEEEILARAKRAMALVGLPEEYSDRSPFDLSGGEKRRAALAGVVAMQPEILVLDEPTAGLDPAGRDALLEMLRKLKEEGSGIVLVSHSMDDVAAAADRIVVMHSGRPVMDAAPREIFRREEELEQIGLAVPAVTHICGMLAKKGLPVRTDVISMDEAAEAIREIFPETLPANA
ncbi:MAG: energy-coupling factor transporter ATPase [Lachnospiraceae bacterium]|nr:energy-coupling factor transporter ATPase [Lachnospiraceae bacterium]MBQ6196981.1 energy-coupling factor transporter ATPase [Lachnospiraceae bacterium]